jgi:hypothetical protein
MYLWILSTPSRERLDDAAIGFVLTRRMLPLPFAHIARMNDMNVFAMPEPRAMAVSISRTRVTPLTWELNTSRARVIVDAVEACTVTLAQQDAPGWSVAVDGKPAKKRLFSQVFRAVDISAGHHEIVWTYHPRSFFFGAIMTLVTLIALTLSVFVKRAR